MIYNFIWNDNREKVKRETMNKKYFEGGLKMIDIDKYIEAIQIKWIKKLTKKNLTMENIHPFSPQVATLYQRWLRKRLLFDKRL